MTFGRKLIGGVLVLVVLVGLGVFLIVQHCTKASSDAAKIAELEKNNLRLQADKDVIAANARADAAVARAKTEPPVETPPAAPAAPVVHVGPAPAATKPTKLPVAETPVEKPDVAAAAPTTKPTITEDLRAQIIRDRIKAGINKSMEGLDIDITGANPLTYEVEITRYVEVGSMPGKVLVIPPGNQIFTKDLKNLGENLANVVVTKGATTMTSSVYMRDGMKLRSGNVRINAVRDGSVEMVAEQVKIPASVKRFGLIMCEYVVDIDGTKTHRIYRQRAGGEEFLITTEPPATVGSKDPKASGAKPAAPAVAPAPAAKPQPDVHVSGPAPTAPAIPATPKTVVPPPAPKPEPEVVVPVPAVAPQAPKASITAPEPQAQAGVGAGVQDNSRLRSASVCVMTKNHQQTRLSFFNDVKPELTRDGDDLSFFSLTKGRITERGEYVGVTKPMTEEEKTLPVYLPLSDGRKLGPFPRGQVFSFDELDFDNRYLLFPSRREGVFDSVFKVDINWDEFRKLNGTLNGDLL